MDNQNNSGDNPGGAGGVRPKGWLNGKLNKAQLVTLLLIIFALVFLGACCATTSVPMTAQPKPTTPAVCTPAKSVMPEKVKGYLASPVKARITLAREDGNDPRIITYTLPEGTYVEEP